MTINIKTLKPLTETKYLSVENAWRYRAIMRTFYINDQKFKHWLSKEDVYEAIRYEPLFEEYTLEFCQQDLEALNQWGNLTAVQDTSKVTTYQQFINKQYRYQMTEYAIEIERMTVRIENIFIEGGSLEPTLLERIKEEFKLLGDMVQGDDDQKLDGLWRQLMSDFQRLNQNYQDYIRDWYSAKAEELMKTKGFFLYKEKLIDYLRNFIKELQIHAYEIEKLMKEVNAEDRMLLWNRLSDYEMDIPRIDMEEVSRDSIYENIRGRYTSFEEFFSGSATRSSEVDTILSMTNEIIRRITRYAASILELSSQYSNRKEEYRKMAELFSGTGSIQEAHKLAATVFGISGYKHLVGDLERETESIQSSVYDEMPLMLELTLRIRTYREKIKKTAIADHGEAKRNMRERILQEREEERKILAGYLKSGIVSFAELEGLTEPIRRTLLRWLTKGIQEKGHMTTTEHGQKFRLVNPGEEKRCNLVCEDGTIEMPAYVLAFEEQI